MGSARSPERDRAFDIWMESGGEIKMKDLAAQLGVPDSKVRKWKTLDKWSEKAVERSTQSSGTLHIEEPPKPKCGAPKGNHNARGHGAPKGNQNAVGNKGGAPPRNINAVKTGEYETISWDCLTAEEQELYVQALYMDKATQVQHDLALAAVKERRMLQRVRDLLDGKKKIKETRTVKKEGAKPQVIAMTNTEGQKTEHLVNAPGVHIVEESETEYDAYDTILKIEDGLTRLQNAKTRSLALRHAIESERIELEKLALNKARLLLDIEKSKGEMRSNVHVDALKSKIAARRGGKPDGRA